MHKLLVDSVHADKLGKTNTEITGTAATKLLSQRSLEGGV